MLKPEYKTLISNFSALSFLQIANYLFPFIAVPYLVRVLGPEGYGLVNFASAFVMFFIIFTNYGFDLSASKEISINRNDLEKVSQIFWSVIFVKGILFLLSAVVFFLIVLTIPKFSNNSSIFIYTFITVAGSVLYPVWFFQGMEKMKYTTIINVVIKIFWLLTIFVLVKNKSDLLTLVLINSSSNILLGIISVLAAIYIFKIKFTRIKKKNLVKEFTEGWYLFLSNASTSLYTAANVFILGIFSNNETVGYFAAADKLRLAVQSLFTPVTQTTYPYLSKLFLDSFDKAVSFVKKYLTVSAIVGVSISLICFYFAEELTKIFLGEEFAQSAIIFRIISFLPALILLSNILGIQVMINLNYKKQFTKIIAGAGLMHLILSFIIVPQFFEIGTAVTLLITETVVTILIAGFIKKKKLLETAN